jgi:hypothetical protein
MLICLAFLFYFLKQMLDTLALLCNCCVRVVQITHLLRLLSVIIIRYLQIGNEPILNTFKNNFN